jgi:hypothetical protein
MYLEKSGNPGHKQQHTDRMKLERKKQNGNFFFAAELANRRQSSVPKKSGANPTKAF